MSDEHGPRDKWWLGKRWWIPGALLTLLAIVDLVAAFRFAGDKDLRGSILALLTPLVAVIAGGAALLNLQETRRQNDRAFETTARQLELARDHFAESQVRAQEQVELQRRGQVTERFTKAIEQLGSDKLDIRIGGIYALEQIARDSEDLHWPVIQVLTAFLREHSGKADAEGEEGDPVAVKEREMLPARADFLAVADVIRRRRSEWDPRELIGEGEEEHSWGARLDLEGCDLRAADLRGAHLDGADFGRANLQWANFIGAQLHGASFTGAQLREANFGGAELDQIEETVAEMSVFAISTFRGANLEGANFASARLEGVDFEEAQLNGAYFGGANLQRAGFTRAQLQGAFFSKGTQLHGTDFCEAQLGGANFNGTNLTDALALTREQLESVVWDDKPHSPAGSSPTHRSD